MIKRLLSTKGLKEITCFVVLQEALDAWIISGGLGVDEIKNDLGKY